MNRLGFREKPIYPESAGLSREMFSFARHPLLQGGFLLFLASLLAASAAGQVDEIVVETDRPAWGAISAVESVRIGVVEGAPEYQFGSVSALALSTDGSILVADRGVPVIRRYDQNGAYLNDLGRGGEGPGEYNAILGMQVLRDGSVVVWDPGHRRMSFFRLDGTYIESVAVNVGLFGSRVFFADGTDDYFFRTVRFDSNNPPTPGVSLPESYLQIGRDGTEKRQIEIPTSDWPRSYVLVSPEGSTNPFTGAQYHAISPNGDLIVGNNVEYSIEFMRDGVAHKRLRLPYVPIQVGDAEWRQWRDWSAYMSDNNSGGITFPAPPKSKPAFRDVWVDRAGRLWIQRHAAASRVPVTPREPGDARPLFEWRDQPTFDIVDPDGVLLGQVTFPRGVRIYDAIGRTVLATHTDEQGVPFVVLYTIR